MGISLTRCKNETIIKTVIKLDKKQQTITLVIKLYEGLYGKRCVFIMALTAIFCYLHNKLKYNKQASFE